PARVACPRSKSILAGSLALRPARSAAPFSIDAKPLPSTIGPPPDSPDRVKDCAPALRGSADLFAVVPDGGSLLVVVPPQRWEPGSPPELFDYLARSDPVAEPSPARRSYRS